MRPAIWKIAVLMLLATPACADPAGVLVTPSIPACAGLVDALPLLENGCARVLPLPGIDADFPALLRAEEKARTERKGIWNDPDFAIRAPDKARQLLDSYGIVEGTVAGTAKAKNHIYVNFGPDWKTDFTVELTADAARELTARNIDWQALAGHAVRVRGWVFWRYGPAMLATADAQIEIIK